MQYHIILESHTLLRTIHCIDTCSAHCFVYMSNMSVSFGLHVWPLQALKKCQVSLKQLGLIVRVVADIVAVATEVQPIDWSPVPDKRSVVLPTRPIGPAIMPVSWEQLRKKRSSTCVPWDLRNIRPETQRGTPKTILDCPSTQSPVALSSLRCGRLISSSDGHPRKKGKERQSPQFDIKIGTLSGLLYYNRTFGFKA